MFWATSHGSPALIRDYEFAINRDSYDTPEELMKLLLDFCPPSLANNVEAASPDLKNSCEGIVIIC